MQKGSFFFRDVTYQPSQKVCSLLLTSHTACRERRINLANTHTAGRGRGRGVKEGSTELNVNTTLYNVVQSKGYFHNVVNKIHTTYSSKVATT